MTRFHTALRTLATLALAFAAGWLFQRWRVPLPWMLGPLLATALASLAGAPTHSWTPLRNLGQWAIATTLGLYFTPEVTALVLRLWWAIALAIVWALVLGWGFAAWLRQHVPGDLAQAPAARRATAYFASAIGGASEMTLLAERMAARTDLVAASHSLRLLLVTVMLPVGLAWAGLQGLAPAAPLRAVDPAGLALLGGATLVGALALARTRWANPWFMGALAVAMGLTMSGLELSAVPTWASDAAQLVIGISLGVRFRAGFLRSAPRWLAAVAAGTLVMIALSAGFGAVLAWATGLHPVTLALGTAPGGISEMAITAKVLQLGVPVVTAFQVCRLVAVLLLVGPLFRWSERLRVRRGAR